MEIWNYIPIYIMYSNICGAIVVKKNSLAFLITLQHLGTWGEILYNNQGGCPSPWINSVLRNCIHASGSPAGGVGVQYALSISRADCRNLSTGHVTKNPHVNENRALCYDGLENINLRNKNFEDKSTDKQILSKLCFYGCILELYPRNAH